jgi:hypothetical protein
MTRIALTALVPALASAAVAPTADARPDTRQLSCAAVNDLVGRSGEIVMTTGPTTFQRFVADKRYCDRYETLLTFETAARDTPQCVVQSVCFNLKHTGGQR